MAKKSSKCSCPSNSERISTKGRGRGFACRSKKGLPGRPKFKPFVAAVCR